MIRLLLKEHATTGLRYFCKTERLHLEDYKGSGKYWKSHLKTYGNDVNTLWSGEFSSHDVEEFALFVSSELNIVASNRYANLIEENGLDGAPIGNVVASATRKKISSALKGRPSPKSGYVVKDAEKTSLMRSTQMLGRKWVNDGVNNKRVTGEVPEGYSAGRLLTGGEKFTSGNKSGDNTRGKRIFNNGEKHKYFFVGEQLEGWVAGKMEGCQGGTGTHRKGKRYVQ